MEKGYIKGPSGELRLSEASIVEEGPVNILSVPLATRLKLNIQPYVGVGDGMLIDPGNGRPSLLVVSISSGG